MTQSDSHVPTDPATRYPYTKEKLTRSQKHKVDPFPESEKDCHNQPTQKLARSVSCQLLRKQQAVLRGIVAAMLIFMLWSQSIRQLIPQPT